MLRENGQIESHAQSLTLIEFKTWIGKKDSNKPPSDY